MKCNDLKEVPKIVPGTCYASLLMIGNSSTDIIIKSWPKDARNVVEIKTFWLTKYANKTFNSTGIPYTNITRLDLYENPKLEIVDLTKDMNSLIIADLQSNNITKLRLPAEAPDLRMVNLYNNDYLDCDCKLLAQVKKYLKRNVKFQGSVCYSPTSVKGRSLNEYLWDISCTDKNGTEIPTTLPTTIHPRTTIQPCNNSYECPMGCNCDKRYKVRYTLQIIKFKKTKIY